MTSTDNGRPAPLVETLTRREREVLSLLAEGYSAPEIAEKLTVALSSVKTHIQNLYGKLGVNSKREAISRAGKLGLLAKGVAAAITTPAQPSLQPQLPIQVTRFFGRKAEIEQVRQMQGEWRLVTLTGPGGVGKTRLALRVAEEVRDEFLDGVWFVELAALTDSANVGLQVAASLGLSEGTSLPVFERLTFFLRGRRALLVLDNCEHLLEGCAHLVDALLRACPRLQFVATSREPLSIAGEAVFLVPSLPSPNPNQLPPLDRLEPFAALTLFVDRAGAVLPGYSITAANAHTLARICQRLDGIPLALELAAARMRSLDATTLAQRLDQVFQVLTAGSRTALPRHQTLRATIDWSYQLLTEAERRLLRRLSVFAGSWSLEAAEGVCADDENERAQVLDQVAGLIDKSMIVSLRRPGEPTRYSMLEMVHQYAREKLEEAGEVETLQQRHWDYFRRYAEASGRKLMGKERPAWRKRFEADMDNLRVALEWSFRDLGNIEPGVTLALSLLPVWFIWDRSKTCRWLLKGLEACRSGASLPAPLKARFLAWGATTQWGGMLESRWVVPMEEDSLTISRGLGLEHREVLCWSLWVRAMGGFYMVIEPEHWDLAERLLDEQAHLIPLLGPEATIAPHIYQGYNLWLRAVLANYRGQHASAEAYARESIRLFETWGNEMHLVSPYIALGDARMRAGAFDDAHRTFTQALEKANETGGTIDCRFSDCQVMLCETETRRGDLARALAYCRDYLRYSGWIHGADRLEMAARILALDGQDAEAARLSGAAEALSEQWGRPNSSKAWPETYSGDARSRLADVALDRLVPDWQHRPDGETVLQAWNEGRTMTFEQARDYALFKVEISGQDKSPVKA